MKNNIQIPKGFKPYKTIEGKFAAHIGPYYIKYKYPRTVFTVFIDNKLPAVTGDQTTLVIGGTPRVLTGPFQHANIIIGSNL